MNPDKIYTTLPHLEDLVFASDEYKTYIIEAMSKASDYVCGSKAPEVRQLSRIMRTKWDGAPCICVGIDDTGVPFVGIKSAVANKSKRYYTGKDIDGSFSGPGGDLLLHVLSSWIRENRNGNILKNGECQLGDVIGAVDDNYNPRNAFGFVGCKLLDNQIMTANIVRYYANDFKPFISKIDNDHVKSPYPVIVWHTFFGSDGSLGKTTVTFKNFAQIECEINISMMSNYHYGYTTAHAYDFLFRGMGGVVGLQGISQLSLEPDAMNIFMPCIRSSFSDSLSANLDGSDVGDFFQQKLLESFGKNRENALATRKTQKFGKRVQERYDSVLRLLIDDYGDLVPLLKRMVALRNTSSQLLRDMTGKFGGASIHAYVDSGNDGFSLLDGNAEGYVFVHPETFKPMFKVCDRKTFSILNAKNGRSWVAPDPDDIYNRMKPFDPFTV